MSQSRAENSGQAGLPAFVWWATTIAWMVTIYQLSTGTFAALLTGWLLSEVFGLLGIKVSAATFDLIHHLLRKLAHLTEYAVLGALLARALARPALAILAGGLYAASDEIHQHFVRGRHGVWYDVVIDTIGVTIGVIAWRRSRWSAE